MEVVLHAVLWIASRGDSQTTHTDILTDSLSALKSGKWNGKSSVLPMPHPHFRLVSGNGSCHACCSLDCNVESVPQNWAVYISMKKERVQESPDWHVTMFGISTFKGDGGCAIMDRLESREMTQQTGWRVRMFNIYFWRFLWTYCCGQTGIQKKTTEQINWQAKHPSHAAFVSADPKCWGARDAATCWHKGKDITPLISWRREAEKEEALDLPKKEKKGTSLMRPTMSQTVKGNTDVILNLNELNWCHRLRRVLKCSVCLSKGVACFGMCRTALAVEQVIRDCGAIPATIGVLKGCMCVGKFCFDWCV